MTQECCVHQAQLPLDVSGGSNSISVLEICSLIYRHSALMDMFTTLLHPHRDHNTAHREATFIDLSKNNLLFRGRGYYLTAHVRKKEKQSFSDNYTLRFVRSICHKNNLYLSLFSCFINTTTSAALTKSHRVISYSFAVCEKCKRRNIISYTSNTSWRFFIFGIIIISKENIIETHKLNSFQFYFTERMNRS